MDLKEIGANTWNWVDSAHDMELYSLYHSSNIVKVIKSRRLRWASDVTRLEEWRSAFKLLTGKSTGKRPSRKSRR